jgi:hypothetical protein
VYSMCKTKRCMCVLLSETLLTVSTSKYRQSKNKNIIFTHLITDSNAQCFTVCFRFISATNLDDTKTIFDDQATNLVMHDG